MAENTVELLNDQNIYHTAPAAKPVLGDDFTEDYANNFQFEMGVWDFKILFGQADQISSPNHINWHTAMTMPWGVAKVLSYFLQINLLAFQLQHGFIEIPKGMIPPAPPAPSGEDDTPVNRLFHEVASSMYLKTFDNPLKPGDAAPDDPPQSKEPRGGEQEAN